MMESIPFGINWVKKVDGWSFRIGDEEFIARTEEEKSFLEECIQELINPSLKTKLVAGALAKKLVGFRHESN